MIKKPTKEQESKIEFYLNKWLAIGKRTEDILNEKNADIRREIVRKIPPETLVEILIPEVMDERFGYQLLGIDLGDERIRPFLKMENPSIKTIHIEGVGPACDSVLSAIEFRNSTPKLPMTLDGSNKFNEELGDYHQQGDALFFEIDNIPEDASESKTNIAADGLQRHIVENGKVYENESNRYVVADDNCKIVHPEHNTTLLPKGNYEIKKVMEYDHWLEESREVID